MTPLIAYDKAGDGDYYLVPKARGKETMVEPYLYPIDGVQVLMTSAVVPITIDNKVVGVAGVDLPLKTFRKKQKASNLTSLRSLILSLQMETMFPILTTSLSLRPQPIRWNQRNSKLQLQRVNL